MKKNSGFTLIEVLVAMLVLAIGMLGLAGITVVVLRSNTLSQQMSEATTVASDLMDILKNQPVSSLLDCENALSASSCAILSDSGLGGLSNSLNWAPPRTNGDLGCALPNILSSTAATFDLVNSNLTEANTYQSSDNLCNYSSSVMPPKTYYRYYRTASPSSGTYTIFVGVLWKDKFGKWRNVHLSTTRTSQ